jgi:hypothetical protein
MWRSVAGRFTPILQGGGNVVIGNSALPKNTTGYSDTAVGMNVMANVKTSKALSQLA